MPLPPPKSDIDVGFKEIRSSIKFAMALTGQYRNRHVVAQFHFTSLVMESEAITPYEILLQSSKMSLSYFSGDFGVGYRILKDRKIEWDALLGLKYIYFKVGLATDLLGTYTIEGARDHFWIDPAIATNFKYRPHPRFELVSYGDLGSSFGRDINYQLLVGVNYIISKHWFATLGYRHIHAEVFDEEAIYNGYIHGMLLRIGAQF
jgi:hypothetical protein